MKVVVLFSFGIDLFVVIYLMFRRGVEIMFIYFR